jgi:hypothetical protein
MVEDAIGVIEELIKWHLIRSNTDDVPIPYESQEPEMRRAIDWIVGASGETWDEIRRHI